MGQLFKNFRVHRLRLETFKFIKTLIATILDLFPIPNVAQQIRTTETQNILISTIKVNGSCPPKTSKVYKREMSPIPP